MPTMHAVGQRRPELLAGGKRLSDVEATPEGPHHSTLNLAAAVVCKTCTGFSPRRAAAVQSRAVGGAGWWLEMPDVSQGRDDCSQSHPAPRQGQGLGRLRLHPWLIAPNPCRTKDGAPARIPGMPSVMCFGTDAPRGQ